jgi:hypothetical protein
MASRSHYSVHAARSGFAMNVSRAIWGVSALVWCLHADRAFPTMALTKRSCTRLMQAPRSHTFDDPRFVLHLNLIESVSIAHANCDMLRTVFPLPASNGNARPAPTGHQPTSIMHSCTQSCSAARMSTLITGHASHRLPTAAGHVTCVT